ncbi:MAG: Ulp1 family isopeptidase [Sedimenticola sp.]
MHDLSTTFYCHFMKDLPQQANNRDCGVFMLQFARCVVNNKTALFSQVCTPLKVCKAADNTANVYIKTTH